MTKEVQMTIRIEPELRAEFTAAASRDHRPAAQVLRELMRGYVKQVSAKDRASPIEAGLDAGETQDSSRFGMCGEKEQQALQVSRVVQTTRP